MILVIKNADYSAKNLGKVEVKRVLNQFTLAAIEASGNTSMTAEQKSALDTFFQNVGAFGSANSIWSKLDKVYIPFLCSSLSNACINYKTNKSDKELSAERYTLRNRGVTGVIESPANYTESNISDMHVIDSNSLTIAAMLMEDDKSLTNSSELITYNGNSKNNRFNCNIQKTGGGDALFSLSYITPGGGVNSNIANDYLAKKHSLFGIVIRSANDYSKITKESVVDITDELSYISNTSNDTGVSSYGIFTQAVLKASSSKSPSIGLLIIGKGLTHEEAVTLKSATETLVNFFT